MLNYLPFKPLDRPELLVQAAPLPKSGVLRLSKNKLCFLDLSDAYIHQLFPLLAGTPAQKPDYFGEGGIGAHISVVYPEESRSVPEEYLGQTHAFRVTGAFTADLGLKRYYVLGVEAPDLLRLRRKLDLPDQLAFKNFYIDLHITIGVSMLS